MKTLIAIVILATAVFADNTSSFEVKELSPEATKKLADSEKVLASAMELLAQAQEDVKRAERERETAKAEALSSVGAMQYEGQCSDVSTHTGSLKYIAEYRRLFTRVEIRGKYALVTAGQEACYPSIFLGTNTITAPVEGLHGSNWMIQAQ